MSLIDAFGEVMGGSGEIIIDHDGKIIETMLSGKGIKEIPDYKGDIIVTNKPLEDMCSIRVVHGDKIKFLYVGASQYFGNSIFFDETFLLDDAIAIRDALTKCIDEINGTSCNKMEK